MNENLFYAIMDIASSSDSQMTTQLTVAVLTE